MAPIRILTVGDGDLTLSLALVRAYGGNNNLRLTASVLEDSPEELLKRFENAPLDELKAWKVEVLYGVDATQLHKRFLAKAPPSAKHSFDLVCFHHPHLGLASLQSNEAHHANRHFRLLCHYLHSAKQVSRRVHVCLCGTQPKTWRLLEAAQSNNMKLVLEASTAIPFCKLWSSDDDDDESKTNLIMTVNKADPRFAAPRRYRNGKLGSRHMLGKYGYRHRRTEGDRYSGRASDTNVIGSIHFVFQDAQTATRTIPATVSPMSHVCSVCQATFATLRELSNHLDAPAIPEVNETTMSDGTTAQTIQNKDDSSCNTILNKPEQSETSSSGVSRIDDLDMEKSKELIVSNEAEGKRLRWFLQKNVSGLSKRQAEVSIQNGLVLLNGEQALDSSRILRCGDVILVCGTQHHQPTIPKERLEILYRDPPLLVAFKPAGMRTKGRFPQTMEFVVSEQEGTFYSSLSPLDTSSPGLCALIQNEDGKNNITPPSILHSLTALVYGPLPDDGWKPYRDVTIAIQPKWKKKKRKQHDVEDDGSSPTFYQERARLYPLQDTQKMIQGNDEGSTSVICLSTIRIETNSPSAASWCRFLRLDGCGVVGDTHCRREYLTLKRSIRNRIKDKCMIGCYHIRVNGVDVRKELPEKLLASFWKTYV